MTAIRNRFIGLGVAAALVIGMAGTASADRYRHNRGGEAAAAVIGGLALGAIAGAAIAGSRDYDDGYYGQPQPAYQPRYAAPAYGGYYEEPRYVAPRPVYAPVYQPVYGGGKYGYGGGYGYQPRDRFVRHDRYGHPHRVGPRSEGH